MSDPSGPTTLRSLYSTKRKDGLPPFLAELYPTYLNSRHYLGTAGSCKSGGPGIYYTPWDCESDICFTLKIDVEWGRPRTPKRPPGQPASDTATALYRLHDKRGTLIYVGISDSPTRRWAEHATDKPWFPEVAHLSLEWFKSRPAALAAEALAIQTERPLHNVVHKGDAAT